MPENWAGRLATRRRDVSGTCRPWLDVIRHSPFGLLSIDKIKEFEHALLDIGQERV